MTLRWSEGERLPEAIGSALLGRGAPFEITVEDVLGSRMEVFAQRHRSIPALLASGVERFGDRPYVSFPDRSWSYRSVIEPVAAVAGALRDEYGIGPGDRVGIVAANVAEWALTFWATTCLGAMTVALNGWWTGPEIAYGVELTTPKVVFGDRRRLERIGERDLGVPVVEFEDGFAALEAHAPVADVLHIAMGEDDPYLILFTSGTTGRPKGAVLSHRSTLHFIQSSLLNAAVGAATSVPAGPAGAARPVVQPCTINASPLFHVSGLNCQLVMAAATGMHIVYPAPGRWQEETHLQLTEKHGATSWSLVPTQLWRILDYPDLERYDLSTLASVGGGGAVWAPELLRRVGEQLPAVRPALGTGFGSTETNGLGTTLRPQYSFLRPESIGRACPATEVEVRDPATGAEVPDGEVGEICLRTASAFLGYWNNAEATTAALDGDRWYNTGDLGRVVEGFVELAGRRRDLIIRGGENVYPVEIENRILEHPAVAEVAVVGVAHPTLGHEVKAVVVSRPGATVSPDEVRSWSAEALAAFKVPTIVEVVAALPHNASGKVLKHLLEEPGGTAGFVEE